MDARLRSVSRWSLAVVAILLLGACSGSPVIPTQTGGSTAGSPTKGSDPPPATVAPSPDTRVFGAAAPLLNTLSAWTLASKYVLHPDGTFEYDVPGGSVGGSYQEYADGSIAFSWQANRGQWDATGTLSEDKLTVHYNLDMQLSDFEDAVYTLIG